jgi:hypothetical protein
MEDNQDPTIPEEDVLEDMGVQEGAEIQEMIEEEEKIVIVTEIATADVVDGNTVKLKDLNYLIILR